MSGRKSVTAMLCVAALGATTVACGSDTEHQGAEAPPQVTETAYVDEDGNPVDEDGYPIEEAEPSAEPTPESAPNSVEALEQTVRIWSESRHGGDTSIAYDLYTDSCKTLIPENTFGRPDDEAYGWDPEISDFEAEIDGDYATARYNVGHRRIEPSYWRFENGGWKATCEAP